MQFYRKNLKLCAISLLFFSNLFIFYIVFTEAPGKLKVYFLDIGQGDAILIKSPTGNKMLIDGGGEKSQILSELSKALPFYDREIDIVLATHPDQDHIGGLSKVFDKFDVEYVIENGSNSETRSFEDFQSAVRKEGSEKILAHRGMKINLRGGSFFDILFPDRDISSINSNDGSIVGKLVFGESSFLFTGDSPVKIEKYLSEIDGKNLESDVLKVGHHGSKTSSSEVFIGLVDPKYSVISAGKDNRYGHPHKEVLENLTKQKTEVLQTSEFGTIIFKSDGLVLESKTR